MKVVNFSVLCLSKSNSYRNLKVLSWNPINLNTIQDIIVIDFMLLS
jgi:hypothetical protein